MQFVQQQSRVRLYVKRAFIMDGWTRWCRRGCACLRVIESDDLPLNVSRELLQDSAIVRAIGARSRRRCSTRSLSKER